MEDVKKILMSIQAEYLLQTGHNLNMKAIDKCFEALKSCPREPEAINRNEQEKEFCQCSDDAKLMFVCKDCGKEWLVDERQNG